MRTACALIVVVSSCTPKTTPAPPALDVASERTSVIATPLAAGGVSVEPRGSAATIKRFDATGRNLWQVDTDERNRLRLVLPLGDTAMLLGVAARPVTTVAPDDDAGVAAAPDWESMSISWRNTESPERPHVLLRDADHVYCRLSWSEPAPAQAPPWRGVVLDERSVAFTVPFGNGVRLFVVALPCDSRARAVGPLSDVNVAAIGHEVTLTGRQDGRATRFVFNRQLEQVE